MRRKSKGTFWAVIYPDNIAIGNYTTFAECLMDVVARPEIFSTGGTIKELKVGYAS